MLTAGTVILIPWLHRYAVAFFLVEYGSELSLKKVFRSGAGQQGGLVQ